MAGRGLPRYRPEKRGPLNEAQTRVVVMSRRCWGRVRSLAIQIEVKTARPTYPFVRLLPVYIHVKLAR